jgi:hypothetical protein
VLLALNAPVDALPLIALLPDQVPLALHVVAFVLLQVSVDEPPLDTLAGFALSVIVGTGVPDVTVTTADCDVLPPVPVQVSV